MIQPDAILAMLPLTLDDDPAIWCVAGDAVIDECRLSHLTDKLGEDNVASIPATILVPASHTTFRRITAQGLEPAQELAVARVQAQEAAMGVVQTAAAFDHQGQIQIATLDLAVLRDGLDRLEAYGLAISAVVPAAALAAPLGDEILRVPLDGESFLCSQTLCCVDEPQIAAAFFGDANIQTVSERDCLEALVAMSRAGQPDFLEGLVRRQSKNRFFSDISWKWTKRLALLAAFLFFASGLSYWAKVQWAIAAENRAALAAARIADPAIAEIDQAETAMDAALARKGIERSSVATLVAVVWQSVKPHENVVITDMQLAKTGLMKATLSGPDVKSINAALLSIQRAGYKITAVPRTDQSGLTLVDLTVTAP